MTITLSYYQYYLFICLFEIEINIFFKLFIIKLIKIKNKNR